MGDINKATFQRCLSILPSRLVVSFEEGGGILFVVGSPLPEGLQARKRDEDDTSKLFWDGIGFLGPNLQEIPRCYR
jgi:hypothetical protein